MNKHEKLGRSGCSAFTQIHRSFYSLKHRMSSSNAFLNLSAMETGRDASNAVPSCSDQSRQIMGRELLPKSPSCSYRSLYYRLNVILFST